jgi:hypothetical protein
MRVGGRFAYPNLMVVGFVEEGYYDAKTEAPKKKPRYFKTPILIGTKRTWKSRASARGSRTSPTPANDADRVMPGSDPIR